MPSFKTVTIKNANGQEFQIDLSLDDVAIMDNHLDLEVTGRYRENGSNQWREELFIVRLAPSEHKIYVVYKDNIVGEIDLSRRDIAFDAAFDELNASDAWDQAKELFLDNGESVAHAIQGIPVDPIFGCLLKSGLSTAIGQLLECYSQARAFANTRQRIWGTLRCLGSNSLVMASKFTLRTLNCTAMGGWDIV